MSELTSLTLKAARDGLRARRFSSAELARAHVAAIERHRDLNAFITETPERALAMAQVCDARLAAGEGGLLEGVPLAIKDLFCTEGVLTTAGSHILDGFVPPYESTVSRKLWEAGAVCLGKTNLDEFAMGSSNMTSYYGGVRNPWTRAGDNAALVPGGSSGGSAAAVAARLCLGATGTDTGGSIRQPAALLRHRRHQADLWALLALGRGRVRELARPGGADGAHGRGLCPDAPGHGRPRPDGQHLGRDGGARTGPAASPATCAACGSASPRNTRCPACRPRSTRSGARAPIGCAPRVPSWSRSRCRTPNMPCRPTTSSPRPRRPRTSPAMTACASACGSRAGTSPRPT